MIYDKDNLSCLFTRDDWLVWERIQRESSWRGDFRKRAERNRLRRYLERGIITATLPCPYCWKSFEYRMLVRHIHTSFAHGANCYMKDAQDTTFEAYLKFQEIGWE